MAGTVRASVGRLGSGKSYGAVRSILRVLASRRDVVANWPVVLPLATTPRSVLRRIPHDVIEDAGREVARPVQLRVVGSVDELLEAHDCSVFVDEAHLLWPSWEPRAVSASQRWWLSHLRKFGLDLTYITQHEERVAKTLRDLTNETLVWQCFFLPFMTFRGTTWEPGHVGRKGCKTGGQWERFRPWVGGCYASSYCSVYGSDMPAVDKAIVEGLAGARNAGDPLGGVVSRARAMHPEVRGRR